MMIFELNNAEIVLEFSHPTFMLQMSGGYYVSIENPFLLRFGDEPIRVDPSVPASPEQEAAMERFCQEKLQRIEISDDSHLTLITATGATISVGTNPDYDSWSVNGPNRLKIICSHGGELAIWRAVDGHVSSDDRSGKAP